MRLEEEVSKDLVVYKSDNIDGLFAVHGKELRKLGLKRSDVTTKRDCILLFNVLSWTQGFLNSTCQQYIADFIINRPIRSQSHLKKYGSEFSREKFRSDMHTGSSKSSWISDLVRQWFGSDREDEEFVFDLSVPAPIDVVTPRLRKQVRRRVESINYHEYFLNQKFDTVYKRGEQLGKGRYGLVYVATRRSDSLTYAVKEMAIDSTRSLMSAKKELLELKNSNHPNIVKFVEGYIYEKKVWIVMEYCQMGSVMNLARSLELNECHVAFLLHEILCGLDYLHSKGVVHSDLKGANILINANGEVKIADLGLSGMIDMEEREIGGSCYWIAPEAMLAWRYDTKSDIYALGCVCIEMITGYPPCSKFPAVKALYYKAKYGFPMIEGRWSISLKDFIRKCMDPDQERRPDTKSLLQHPFLLKRCSMEEHKRLVEKAYYIRELTSEFD